MKGSGKKISIKELSELSGFSPATVSNALNKKRGVNPATAEQIVRLAQERGYITEDKVKSIRVVTYRDSGEVFSDSPFFSVLLESVENESRKCGYETSIINLYRRHADYEERVKAVLNDTTSGVLLIGTELTDETARPFHEAVLPLVLLDAWMPHLAFNAVLMDNEGGAMAAVEHLIEHGHKRIGYLSGGLRIQNFQARERGFRRAMEAHGLAVDEHFFLEVPPSIQGSHERLLQILAEKCEMPTAFFADNDMIALGAMQAFQTHGWRLPEDVSIVGFDDISFGEVFSPGLTTVRVHKKELGCLAVRRLIELIKKPRAVKTRIEIVNDLVVRGSVAAPRER